MREFCTSVVQFKLFENLVAMVISRIINKTVELGSMDSHVRVKWTCFYSCKLHPDHVLDKCGFSLFDIMYYVL
jgi:hypothetical protein